MACYHSSAKVPEPQVRVAQRSIIYFCEGTECQNRGFFLQALERDHLHEGWDKRNQMTSQPSQGAETWFQVRHQSVLCRMMLRGPVVYGFFWLINVEPRLGPLKPTPGPWSFCQSIQSLFELAYKFCIISQNESFWLFNINLFFQISIKKC